MMKAMLAEIQEKAYANKGQMLAEIKADQEKSDAARKADKEERLAAMKANEEMTARMDAKIGSMHDELKSTIEEQMKDAMQSMLNAWLTDIKNDREETMACQETTEARLQGKPASVDTTPEVAQEQEVPREGAARMPVGEPRKRRRGRRNLAAGRRQKEERNLDARRRGRQQDLVAARRGTTRRATVARHRILLTKDA
jgi:hypothetical protein